MISVILTKYKRTHLFKEQIRSIKNQSVYVDEILVCDNSVDNKGVWERFNVAKKAKNEFVCIIDDDTIPGSLWIENCFSEKEISRLLNIERNSSYFVNRADGRKASIGINGS